MDPDDIQFQKGGREGDEDSSSAIDSSTPPNENAGQAAAKPASDYGEYGTGDAAERIFEVTPDLNIKPVKDTEVIDGSLKENSKIIKNTAIGGSDIFKKPEVLRVPPAPNEPVLPKMPETPKKPEIRREPINKLETVITDARTTPASPQPKTAPFESQPVQPRPAPSAEMPAIFSVVKGGPNPPPPFSVEKAAPAEKTAMYPNVPHDPNLKPLRTYEGDVAEILSHTKASVASIAVAEMEKKESGRPPEEKSPSHALRNTALIVTSLVLLCGGAFGAYYLYSMSALSTSSSTAIPEPQTAVSIIPRDSQATIAINSLSPAAILSRIVEEYQKPQMTNTIKEIVLTQDRGGLPIPVTGPDIVSIMDVSAPDMLTRSLASPWMLGVYADQNGEKSAFVVFTDNFFQNAFAGMLSWESVMPDDIKQYLYVAPPGGVANAPGVPDQGLYSSVRGQFFDRIIENKDVREFKTADGAVLFLYSFIDNSKLIIAGNEQTLSEAVKRLENRVFTR